MIRLVLGMLDYGGIDRGITFRKTRETIDLGGVPDVELTPLGSLLITRVAMLIDKDPSTATVMPGTRLSETPEACPTLTCQLLSYIEYTDKAPEDRNALYHAPIPTVEPISTLLGLLLASSGFSVEFYSDIWPMLTDIITQLRALGIDVAIHTSTLDINRIFAFDEVIRRFIRIPRIDDPPRDTNFSGKYEVVGREYRVREQQVTETSLGVSVRGPRVDEDVLRVVESVVRDFGGVATLKSVVELLGEELVMRAVVMGYLTYNPMDMTVRVTNKGLMKLRQGQPNNEEKPMSRDTEDKEAGQ